MAKGATMSNGKKPGLWKKFGEKTSFLDTPVGRKIAGALAIAMMIYGLAGPAMHYMGGGESEQQPKENTYLLSE